MTIALDQRLAKRSIGGTINYSNGYYAKLPSLTEWYQALLNMRLTVNPDYSNQIVETKKPGLATGLLGPFRTSFLFRR